MPENPPETKASLPEHGPITEAMLNEHVAEYLNRYCKQERLNLVPLSKEKYELYLKEGIRL